MMVVMETLVSPWLEVAKMAVASTAKIPASLTVGIESSVSWVSDKMRPSPLLYDYCMMMAWWKNCRQMEGEMIAMGGMYGHSCVDAVFMLVVAARGNQLIN